MTCVQPEAAEDLNSIFMSQRQRNLSLALFAFIGNVHHPGKVSGIFLHKFRQFFP